MKKKDGFVLRHVNSNLFILENYKNEATRDMITFNSTAAFLWESLEEKEFTQDDVKNLLIKNYSVSTEIAQEDSDAIIREWFNASVVE